MSNSSPAKRSATAPGDVLVSRPGDRPRAVLVPVAMMILACALVAATMLFAKMLGRAVDGPPIHPLQVTAGRYIFALVALAPVIAWYRRRLPPVLRGTAAMAMAAKVAAPALANATMAAN